MYPAYSKVNFINIFNNTDKIYSTALIKFADLQTILINPLASKSHWINQFFLS
jgi:hypothetical protein